MYTQKVWRFVRNVLVGNATFAGLIGLCWAIGNGVGIDSGLSGVPAFTEALMMGLAAIMIAVMILFTGYHVGNAVWEGVAEAWRRYRTERNYQSFLRVTNRPRGVSHVSKYDDDE